MWSRVFLNWKASIGRGRRQILLTKTMGSQNEARIASQEAEAIHQALRPLANALDNLLPFAGFWPSLQIGTFHRVLNLECPEVSYETL